MKGILLKEFLFKQTINHLKNVTRRAFKLRKSLREKYSTDDVIIDSKGMPYIVDSNGDAILINPRYKAGDIVFLKEPYENYPDYIDHDILGDFQLYKFDYELDEEIRKNTKWKNKLFMPSSAARYFIKIISVRCERLEHIDEEEAQKEGFYYKDYLTPYQQFYLAWDDINKKEPYRFDDNPLVWRYSYQLCDKNGKVIFKKRKITKHLQK